MMEPLEYWCHSKTTWRCCRWEDVLPNVTTRIDLWQTQSARINTGAPTINISMTLRIPSFHPSEILPGDPCQADLSVITDSTLVSFQPYLSISFPSIHTYTPSFFAPNSIFHVNATTIRPLQGQTKVTSPPTTWPKLPHDGNNPYHSPPSRFRTCRRQIRPHRRILRSCRTRCSRRRHHQARYVEAKDAKYDCTYVSRGFWRVESKSRGIAYGGEHCGCCTGCKEWSRASDGWSAGSWGGKCTGHAALWGTDIIASCDCFRGNYADTISLKTLDESTRVIRQSAQIPTRAASVSGIGAVGELARA